MKELPLADDRRDAGPADRTDCWTRVGVWGDRSCPELASVVHCHNCPVFAAGGRRFLTSAAPAGYLDEWTARLAEPEPEPPRDLQSVLVFRLGGEWLALPLNALREVMDVRPVRRVPFQGRLLAGVVNVRGELHLCVRLDHLLGITSAAPEGGKAAPRLIVAGPEGETWVFRAEEVDRAHRFPAADLEPVPPTVGRSAASLTRGVLRRGGRAVGVLDAGRVFERLRAGMR